MEWFECFIISKSGQREFWRRFIAVDLNDAIKRNNKVRKNLNLKNKLLSRMLVSEYVVTKVSDDVLSLYDFSSSVDTVLFYIRGKEK